MKKIFSSMMAIAIAAFTFTACEDVPEPYNNPYDQLKNANGGGTGSLPYTSEALNTDWSLQSVTSDQPWITGSNYAQATGYQKWDGASAKSNKAVEGWLVSPAISTVGCENVKLSFDNTIKYTNNVTGWEANHKVYASTTFDGSDASTATWTELQFTPVASTYSDWTLYSSGEIQLPAEFVGKETVYIGFWFKAPESGSTTWELKNFKMEEGIAGNNTDPGTDTPTPTEGEGKGTADSPYDVTAAISVASGTGVYVKGFIVGFISGKSLNEGATLSGTTTDVNTNIMIAASADETDITKCMPVQLPTGDVRSALNLVDNVSNYKKEVTLYGNIEKYFGATGIKSVTYAIIDGNKVGTDPNATPQTPDTPANTIFSESFADGKGNFTVEDKVLSGIWTAGSYQNDKYMMATSFLQLDGESKKTNHDAESWLISPVIDLTNAASAILKFAEVINSYFGTVNDEAMVYAKTENGDWTVLSFTRAEKPSKGYTKFTDATANISIDLSNYKGGKMQFAFVYKGTATTAGTWEIKDVMIVPAE